MYRELLTLLLSFIIVTAAPQQNSNITYIKKQVDLTNTQPEAKHSFRESRIEILPLTIPGNFDLKGSIKGLNVTEITKQEEAKIVPPLYNYSDRIYSIKSKPKKNNNTEINRPREKPTIESKDLATNIMASKNKNKDAASDVVVSGSKNTGTNANISLSENENTVDASDNKSPQSDRKDTGSDILLSENKNIDTVSHILPPENKSTNITSDLLLSVSKNTADVSEILPSESKNIDVLLNKIIPTDDFETDATVKEEVVTEKLEDEPTIIAEVIEETTKASRLPPKLSHFGKSRTESFSQNLIKTAAKRRFRSRCRCEKIWNCAKLQITVPRCPDEYFLCCA